MNPSSGDAAWPERAAGSSARAGPPAGLATVSAPPRTESDPRRWHALAVSVITAFMALLDVSIVNVALPSIERDLGASAGNVQWAPLMAVAELVRRRSPQPGPTPRP